jgi:hypothetical protein
MSITVKSGLNGHKSGYPKHRKTGKFTVPEKSAVWAYAPVLEPLELAAESGVPICPMRNAEAISEFGG